MPSFANIESASVFWFLAIFSCFLIGFSKSGIAGAGVLAIPIMAMIFPPKESTGILLPMLVMGDIIAVSFYRKHAKWRHIIRAMPWAFAGIVMGWAMIEYSGISQGSFKKLIGAIVICVLILGEWLGRNKSQDAIHIPHTWWFAAIVGIIGGFTTMTANAAGPVFAIYLLALSLPKENFIGTTAWIFLILNVVKIPFSWQLGFISSETLVFNLEMLPAIIVGSYVGIKAAKRISQEAFAIMIKLLAALAAINLMINT